MPNRKPAPAADEVVADIVPGTRFPRARMTGDAPETGSRFVFRAQNGVTYAGEVAATEEQDGSVLVSFTDGIEPV